MFRTSIDHGSGRFVKCSANLFNLKYQVSLQRIFFDDTPGHSIPVDLADQKRYKDKEPLRDFLRDHP